MSTNKFRQALYGAQAGNSKLKGLPLSLFHCGPMSLDPEPTGKNAMIFGIAPFSSSAPAMVAVKRVRCET